VRLSTREINNLLQSVSHLDPDAKLYLFGSRTRDDVKGGDIDIALLTDKLSLKDKVEIKYNFFKEFGEQKIDIVLIKNPEQAFWKVIKNKSILLSK
jgi:predicted nucleotidyltransferase